LPEAELANETDVRSSAERRPEHDPFQQNGAGVRPTGEESRHAVRRYCVDGAGMCRLFDATSAVLAQDVKGARDDPLVKRFPGSAILWYEIRDGVEYVVATSPLLKWDYAPSKPDFGSKRLDVEGSATRITYVV
jgi:hypothetical protein